MSTTHSPSQDIPYGVVRVCEVWQYPRASFYRWRERCYQRGHSGLSVTSSRQRRRDALGGGVAGAVLDSRLELPVFADLSH